MNIWKSSLNLRLGSTKVKTRLTPTQIFLGVILALLLVFAALPGYFSGGQWPWQKAPKVAYLKPVRELKDTGLNLPNWQIIEKGKINLGENTWLVQILDHSPEPPISLFLLGQSFSGHQPAVEWTDLKSIENLREESLQMLTFRSQVQGARTVRARFFKGSERTTYAVVQWYAWPKGGDYRLWHWFLGDQSARLEKSSLPWVAVSLKIPLSPLRDLKSVEPLARNLATTIQTSLDTQVFNLVYTKPNQTSEE